MMWNLSLVEKVTQRHLPEWWTPMLPGREIHLVDVDEGTEEYDEVCDKFKKDDEMLLKVKKVQRIQNPFLWGCYLLNKEEYKHLNLNEDEVTLYHVTSKEFVESIIQDNFDWRHYRHTMFGKGVNFSQLVEYARDRANNKGVLFVNQVLRGRCIRCDGYICPKDCDLPPEGYDTTTSGIENSKVVVAYNDNDFYPQYVVYWDTEDEQNKGESRKRPFSLAFPG